MNIYLDQYSLKFYAICFQCMSSWGLSKDIGIKLETIAFTSYKAYLKKKEKSGTTIPISVFALFLEHNVSLVIFYYLTRFRCLVSFVRCYNCLLTRLWCYKFWNQPYLANHDVFFAWLKNQHKNLNILRTKRAFQMN